MWRLLLTAAFTGALLCGLVGCAEEGKKTTTTEKPKTETVVKEGEKKVEEAKKEGEKKLKEAEKEGKKLLEGIKK